jgi:protein-S-isoprenylcysteine O-methyltransferase Ste14
MRTARTPVAMVDLPANTLQDGNHAGSRPRPQNLDQTRLRRASVRWLTVLALMGVLAVLYFQHPYYQNAQFVPWHSLYPCLVGLWAILGLPYTWVTLRRFEATEARSFWANDTTLHWLAILRLVLGRGTFPGRALAISVTAVALIFGAGQLLGLLAMVRGFAVPFALGVPLLSVLVTYVARSRPLHYQRGATESFDNQTELVSRAVRLDLARLKDFPVLGFVWRSKRLKNSVLALTVKVFFAPLMAGFLSGHLTSAGNLWAQKKGLGNLPLMDPVLSYAHATAYMHALQNHLVSLIPTTQDFAGLFKSASYTLQNVRWSFDVLYDVVFIVDCGFALFGYLSESRWLGNKTRSVEPSGLGWMCAIFCYPPFNTILGTYVPFGNTPAWLKAGETYWHYDGAVWLLVLRGLIIAFFMVYSASTVAFGAKFSNLTNRGIVSRGPYRFVRHPAYACKCIAWWLEQMHVINPQTALALIGLCGVYALRAWTEERHLSQDPEYQAYRTKVRWAAIPGLL